MALAALLAATKLFNVWSREPIFSLGFLVAPWAAWWVMKGRETDIVAPTAMRVWAVGLTVWAVSYGWFTGSSWHALWGLAGAFGVLAIERGRFLQGLVPIVVLALTAPPPWFDEWLVSTQLLVATTSAAQLSFVGFPIERELFYLHTENYSFEVAPICAGFSSLLATAALVGMVGAHTFASGIRLSLAWTVGIAAAVVFNIERVAISVVIAETWGPAYVQGAFHDGISLIMAMAAFGLSLPVLLWRRNR